MFENHVDYLSTYGIIKSHKFDLSPTNYFNFKSLKETCSFAFNKRKLKSPINKLTKEQKLFLKDELNKNNTISLHEMKKKLISDKFEINISISKIG